MIYSFMTFSTPEQTLDEIFNIALEYRYDAIEPRVGSGHKHRIETDSSATDRENIRKKSEETGIKLCCLASSCKFADPAETAENVEQTHKVIDLAADVGAPCIRVFGGPFPDDISRNQALENVAKALKSLCAHAEERNVIVCMETHDSWCNPEHVARIMRKVNHPFIAVNWDIMHPVRMGFMSIERSFEALKPWIRHVHVHDGGTVDIGLCQTGLGIIDHRKAIELLLSINYEGVISGEWIKWVDTYPVYLPREIAILRSYETAIRMGLTMK